MIFDKENKSSYSLFVRLVHHKLVFSCSMALLSSHRRYQTWILKECVGKIELRSLILALLPVIFG